MPPRNVITPSHPPTRSRVSATEDGHLIADSHLAFADHVGEHAAVALRLFDKRGRVFAEALGQAMTWGAVTFDLEFDFPSA